MTFWSWSRTAASNASADATINFAEGQAPSSVNDSARAVMAAAAKYRDDISGAIATGGTSTAYTVTSYEVFDTLAHMNGAMVAFTPHTTNGATVTLNVDGLGAKPLRSAPSTELLAGVLIQGTPYVATYNNSDAVWYLQSFYGNPYSIPLGGGLPFFGSTAPNSSFVFPYGQQISQTTYSALYALFGNTYGTATGGMFFLPDIRGRVIAGKDDMGGSAASRLTSSGAGFGGSGAATLGATGGAESQTLNLAQLPTGITSSGSNSISVSSNSGDVVRGSILSSNAAGGSNAQLALGATSSTVSSTGTNAIAVTSNNTGAGAHPIVQPTIIGNYILRII